MIEAQTQNTESKKLRFIELILILSAAFLSPLAVALYVYIFDENLLLPSSNKHLGIYLLLNLIPKIVALAVLYYVLFRQNRKLKDIGISFNWKDIPLAIILTVVLLVFALITMQVVRYLGSTTYIPIILKIIKIYLAFHLPV